jgi:hypothetical protein
MTDKQINPGTLRSLWQKMPTDPVSISAEEMRAKAKAFERRVRRRNFIEYGAIIFVVVLFSWHATWPKPATPLWPIANILIALGALYMGFNLHRLARAASASPAASVTGLIDFHRAELVRQRNALATVWRWYVLPFTPGVVLWLVAQWVGAPAAAQTKTAMGILMVAIICIAGFAGIILLNLLGAARLQRMIEDLDRYKEKP